MARIAIRIARYGSKTIRRAQRTKATGVKHHARSTIDGIQIRAATQPLEMILMGLMTTGLPWERRPTADSKIKEWTERNEWDRERA